jgi:hypothetical protein
MLCIELQRTYNNVPTKIHKLQIYYKKLYTLLKLKTTFFMDIILIYLLLNTLTKTNHI